MGAIAATNQVTLAALLAVNPAVTNANLIYVDQVINIPTTTVVIVACKTPTTPRRGRSNDTSGENGSIEGFTGGNDASGTTGLEITVTDVAVEPTKQQQASSAPATYARASVLPLAVAVTLLGVVSMAFAS